MVRFYLVCGKRSKVWRNRQLIEQSSKSLLRKDGSRLVKIPRFQIKIETCKRHCAVSNERVLGHDGK